MCVFSGQKPVKVHKLTTKNPIIAYRVLRVSRRNTWIGTARSSQSIRLTSPYMNFVWDDLKLSAKTLNKHGNSGIYAYKTRGAAYQRPLAGDLLVKVALWGQVYEYACDRVALTAAGYRAKHAEVLAVWLTTAPSPSLSEFLSTYRGSGVIFYEHGKRKQNVA